MSAPTKDSKCINCGAAVSFEEKNGELVESVKCAFCGAVNLRAQAEARARRAEERKLERAGAARRRFFLLIAGGVALVFALAVGTAVREAGRGVIAAHAELERARAQVVNVRQRQAEVIAQLSGSENTPEHEAELTGAANRVRVERGRYDQAVAGYNAAAQGVFGEVAARLHGWSATAPTSDAVTW